MAEVDLSLIGLTCLFGLCFCRDGVQHLGELMHINPAEQRSLTITCDAFVEQGMVPTCKREYLASSENAFAATSITGGLDRNLVHDSSLESKNRPSRAVG